MKYGKLKILKNENVYELINIINKTIVENEYKLINVVPRDECWIAFLQKIER